MCGRFSLSAPPDFYAAYLAARIVTEALSPSYNVAPTDAVYAVAERDGERLLYSMRWGLLPHWDPERSTGHINARAKTVANLPVFRDSFRRKRCLIPADGFYEWESAPKIAHYIYRADGAPLAFAGIWASWQQPTTGEWSRSCAIVTAKADGVILSLHDRMPVAMRSEVWDAWLDGDLREPEAVAGLLQPIEPDLWTEHRVSPLVNSVRNNSPECRVPIEF